MPAALGVPHVSGLVVKLMSAVFLDRYGKFPDRKLSLYRHCFLLHSFIYVCVCVCPCAMEVRGQLAEANSFLPRGSRVELRLLGMVTSAFNVSSAFIFDF